MRLNAEQTATIRRIVTENAGSDVEVRLFGSRLDDSARGGDIVWCNVTRGNRLPRARLAL